MEQQTPPPAHHIPVNTTPSPVSKPSATTSPVNNNNYTPTPTNNVSTTPTPIPTPTTYTSPKNTPVSPPTWNAAKAAEYGYVTNDDEARMIELALKESLKTYNQK